MENREYLEKILHPANGFLALIVLIALFAGGLAMLIIGAVIIETGSVGVAVALMIIGAVLTIGAPILMAGLKIVGPNEAIVLVLFGKYHGTIKDEGFFYVNPFCVSVNAQRAKTVNTDSEDGAAASALRILTEVPKKKLSLKAITLTNGKQKVNDLEGNPIEIGVVVIWRIVNTAKAVFNVDDYFSFVSTQADSSIRQVARLYPYDVSDEGDEKSLRGSSVEIAESLKKELQERVDVAGIEIIEARISHLAYAPEIAAAMLQRQQARAIITARQMIVEGAVGMVEMALEKLSEKNVVELDEERKAQKVSNLLVVLCGNKDAQPIVNSGTIY